MAAISGKTKCAWPTLFPYPCGDVVLIVESNYEYSQRGFLKNCSLPELSKDFLLKHTTKIPYFINILRTEVNFYNPFSENFVHNIGSSLIPLKSLRMNGNNVGHWVEVFFIPRLNALAPPTSTLFHFFY